MHENDFNENFKWNGDEVFEFNIIPDEKRVTILKLEDENLFDGMEDTRLSFQMVKKNNKKKKIVKIKNKPKK
jgi:hypothetical protein